MTKKPSISGKLLDDREAANMLKAMCPWAVNIGVFRGSHYVTLWAESARGPEPRFGITCEATSLDGALELFRGQVKLMRAAALMEMP